MENKNGFRVLVVDDEEDIREIIQFNLENEGYEVEEADSAEQALEMLQEKHYHLILLDVMMGGMSGFKMADRLRKEENNVPIIFLTAKNSENDMLTGFSIGGDDYIKKPFSVKEVIARVKSVLRRGEQSAEKTVTVFEAEGLRIDFEQKRVWVDKEEINLTKTEYRILCLLAENRGRVFTRAELLDRVWSDEVNVLERTVDVHIARLRRKLGKYGELIVNRSGYGYALNL